MGAKEVFKMKNGFSIWCWYAQQKIKEIDTFMVLLLYMVLLIGNILFFYELFTETFTLSISDIFFGLLGCIVIVSFVIYNYLLLKLKK